MTRDGTVGRSDATERSLPVHRDIDPARVMRPRFADSIRASSPSGLREQAGHMTASDLCAARQIISCHGGVAGSGTRVARGTDAAHWRAAACSPGQRGIYPHAPSALASREYYDSMEAA